MIHEMAIPEIHTDETKRFFDIFKLCKTDDVIWEPKLILKAQVTIIEIDNR